MPAVDESFVQALLRRCIYLGACLSISITLSVASAGVVSYSVSNVGSCPPKKCERGDPRNPIPLTDVPFSAVFELPKFSPSFGELSLVEIWVFLNTQISISGRTTADMLYPFGWGFSRKVTTRAGGIFTFYDEVDRDGWIAAPTECAEVPPPSDQICMYSAGTALTVRSDDETEILRFFDQNLDVWIGTGEISFDLTMLQPDVYNLTSVNIGQGTVPISMPFEIDSYVMQGEMMFAQVSYHFQHQVPEPSSVWLTMVGIALAYSTRRTVGRNGSP